jgi:hypothetical protein
MSKESIKQTADKLFASTANNVLWANPKGEFFTSKNTGSLSLKTGEKLTKFERAEEKKDSSAADEKEYEFNAKYTIAKIKAVTSLEDLKAFEGDERKSVITEYEKQHAKLTAEIKVNLDDKGEGTGHGNEDTDNKE